MKPQYTLVPVGDLAEKSLSKNDLGLFLGSKQRVIAASLGRFYVLWTRTDKVEIIGHLKVTGLGICPKRGLEISMVSDQNDVIWVDNIPQRLPNTSIFAHIPTDARVQIRRNNYTGHSWCSIPITFSSQTCYQDKADKGPFISDLSWFRANIEGQQNLHLD